MCTCAYSNAFYVIDKLDAPIGPWSSISSHQLTQISTRFFCDLFTKLWNTQLVTPRWYPTFFFPSYFYWGGISTAIEITKPWCFLWNQKSMWTISRANDKYEILLKTWKHMKFPRDFSSKRHAIAHQISEWNGIFFYFPIPCVHWKIQIWKQMSPFFMQN